MISDRVIFAFRLSMLAIYILIYLASQYQNYLAYALIECNAIEESFVRLKSNQSLTLTESALIKATRLVSNFLIRDPWKIDVDLVIFTHHYAFTGQMCEDMRKVHTRCNGTFDGSLQLDLFHCYEEKMLDSVYRSAPGDICSEEMHLAVEQLRPYLEIGLLTESGHDAPAANYILSTCCSVFPTKEEIKLGKSFQFYPVWTRDVLNDA